MNLGAVIFCVQNAFPGPPVRADGSPYSFPNITRLVCQPGGSIEEGLFAEEQDWYNPMYQAQAVAKAWRKAGGTFGSKEKLKMQHRL